MGRPDQKNISKSSFSIPGVTEGIMACFNNFSFLSHSIQKLRIISTSKICISCICPLYCIDKVGKGIQKLRNTPPAAEIQPIHSIFFQKESRKTQFIHVKLTKLCFWWGTQENLAVDLLLKVKTRFNLIQVNWE